MSKAVTYKPKGVCATKIEFEIDDDGNLHNVKFTNGCDGNAKAIGLIVEGRNAMEIADLFAGNTCGFKNTSCVDQLAKGIREAVKTEK